MPDQIRVVRGGRRGVSRRRGQSDCPAFDKCWLQQKVHVTRQHTLRAGRPPSSPAPPSTYPSAVAPLVLAPGRIVNNHEPLRFYWVNIKDKILPVVLYESLLALFEERGSDFSIFFFSVLVAASHILFEDVGKHAGSL